VSAVLVLPFRWDRHGGFYSWEIPTSPFGPGASRRGWREEDGEMTKPLRPWLFSNHMKGEKEGGFGED